MVDLKMHLSRPPINPGKGSLLSSLLSRRPHRRRFGGGGGGRSSSQLPEIDLSHATRSEKEAYFANPKVQEALMKRVRLESDLEYRAFEQRKAEVQEERLRERLELDKTKESYQRNKDLVYKSIELLNKAKTNGNMALQRNIIHGMESYIRNLDPHMQALIAPIVASGPFSPEAGKMRRWDEMHPTPQVSADPELQPQIAAMQYNELAKWGQARSMFQFGKAGPKQSFIRMSENMYAILGDNPRAVSAEDIKLEAFAKKYDKTPGEILANGGYRGPVIETQVEGKKYKSRWFVGLDGRRALETVGEEPTKELKAAQQFATVWSDWEELDDDVKEGEKNSLIALGKRLVEDEGWDLRRFSDTYVKPIYGMNLIERPDGTAAMVPGRPDVLEGIKVFVTNEGKFYSSLGEELGSYEEAQNEIQVQKELGMIYEEQRKEAKRITKQKVTRRAVSRAGRGYIAIEE